MADQQLLGRDEETVRLAEMIVAVRSGESRVLVIRGPPGVGKSALIAHVEAAATGLRVLRATGTESETELAYAALHQLCAPLLDRLGRLPEPQRLTLETVFRMRAGRAADNFLIGLAVLSLLTDATEQRPLLCLIDDAQWLDRASAQVLGFVARRLLAESVCLLFGTRQPGPELRGLPELEVTGLADTDARTLLRSVANTRLDPHIRDRIVAETQGNPLALLNMPRGLTATQLAGGLGLLTADTAPGGIEDAYAKRIRVLPTHTRQLLLVAAADLDGDAKLVRRAAGRLGIPFTEALDDGIDGLLTLNERVIFRHPLVRSAVYRTAEPGDRWATHRALAEATDPRTAADRRAWHLACAAAGPDEAVAAELERCAERAQTRGGMAAAAAFLQRAVALSEEPARRAERGLAAAAATLAAGEFDVARGYLDAADRGPGDEFLRARAQLLRGRLAFASGLGANAWPLLLDAAQQLQTFDMTVARETYLTAWGAAVVAADQDGLLRVSTTIGALAQQDGEQHLIDRLLSGYALLITGARVTAIAVLRRAVPASAQISSHDVLRWGWVAAGLGPSLWDDKIMRSMYARGVQVTRDAGALTDLALHLTSLALAVAWAGDFPQAGALATEAELIATATGSPVPPNGALRLSALRGREPEAATLIETTIEQATTGGQGLGLAVAHWSAATLYNGLAKYEQAVTAARAAALVPEPWISGWALPELIEGAARLGDHDLAREALARLTAATGPCDTDWGLGILARCRALVSEGPQADALHGEAIERLGRTGLRPELARAHLLYGEWLRRERRRVDARHQLHTAYDMCTEIGMEGFAERARRELMATGETVRKRTSGAAAAAGLTAQEGQIAQLVARGFSNSEVGARLFLSPRTVEWHLRKIFAKLNIMSRRQLRNVSA